VVRGHQHRPRAAQKFYGELSAGRSTRPRYEPHTASSTPGPATRPSAAGIGRHRVARDAGVKIIPEVDDLEAYLTGRAAGRPAGGRADRAVRTSAPSRSHRPGRQPRRPSGRDHVPLLVEWRLRVEWCVVRIHSGDNAPLKRKVEMTDGTDEALRALAEPGGGPSWRWSHTTSCLRVRSPRRSTLTRPAVKPAPHRAQERRTDHRTPRRQPAGCTGASRRGCRRFADARRVWSSSLDVARRLVEAAADAENR